MTKTEYSLLSLAHEAQTKTCGGPNPTLYIRSALGSIQDNVNKLYSYAILKLPVAKHTVQITLYLLTEDWENNF